MFSLTVIDHVRLDSEHVAQNYTIHARAADRFARLAFGVRMVMALLLAVATAACILDLLITARIYQITAEANDGLIDPHALLQRRDQLIERVHSIYEGGFTVDQRGYEAARLAIDKPGAPPSRPDTPGAPDRRSGERAA